MREVMSVIERFQSRERPCEETQDESPETPFVWSALCRWNTATALFTSHTLLYQNVGLDQAA